MKSYVSNRDISLIVPFEQDGEPFVPDAGSLVYSLIDPNGSLLIEDEPLTTTDTSVKVQVPAVHNALSAQAPELRFVELRGELDGTPFEIFTSYRLVPRIFLTATPQDVRAFLGVDNGELPDADIDLLETFLELEPQIPDARTLLSQDTEAGRNVNRAVVYQTVLKLLPSLPQRLSKSETDGTSKVDRFNIDFAALEREARNRLSAALGTEVVNRSLIQFTTRADPLTGA